MAKVVSFPLALGRRDSIDPKFAPMGVLGICKNLRVRKDGRLVSRNGYEAVTMSGATVGYDLMEYQGRLVLFGTKSTEGYQTQPIELTEFTSSALRWRTETTALQLTPFTALKNITLTSPPSSGVAEADSAVGNGYVCSVQKSVDGTVFAVVCRESNNQAINTELISTTRFTNNFRVTYEPTQGSFLIASQRADNSIDILKFTVGTDASWQLLVSQVETASGTIATFDIVAVKNPTTAAIAFARDRGAATTSLIRMYSGAGAQVGSDITYGAAGDNTASISVDADQTANKIHVLNVYTGGTGELRTFNFATALLLGPTAIVPTTATHGSLCRIPSATAQIAVAVSTSAGNTWLKFFSEAAHANSGLYDIFSVVMTTRLLSWTTAAAPSVSFLYAVIFGGYVAPNIASTTSATNALFFYGAAGSSSIVGGIHMATRDFVSATPRSFRNMGLHLDPVNNQVGWCSLRDTGTGSSQACVTTFPFHSAARRQTAKFGALTYIAGAPVQVFDGRCLAEAFQEVPGIISATPSNGAGTLTNSGSYSYVVHWEMTLADGSVWISPPSTPTAVTMGAADDTVTLVCSTPHHSAIGLGLQSYGPEITLVVSRTVFSDGLAGSVYRRAVVDNVPATHLSYGATLTMVDTVPDSTLATAEALYTQNERGNLSGVLEHNGPRPSQFVAASESRLYLAGQLSDNQFQASKEAFLGEPFTFSEFSTFFGQVSGTVRGLFSLDGSRLIFTADDIFAVSGGGPDDLGGGSLLPPVRVPTPSGLEDWRSFLEAPEGLYFQLDDGKLYQLPRGGDSPVWAGVDIQDTLASYPVITGACKSRRDDCLLFACQNTSAGTDARIVVRSLRTGLWSEDTPPLTASEGIEAITAYGDSVAYISGGNVYVQSTSSYADGASTVIPCVWKTLPLYPFGLGGTGLIHDLLAVGEYLSAGTLALRVSYDDGVSFTSLVSYALTGLTVGQTIRRKWALPQVGARSIIAEWTFTPSSAGAGFILQNAALLVTQDEGLPELLPAEAA